MAETETHLSLLAREVVGGLERALDTLLDGSITAVVGAENGVLEATWVPDVDVELAVLAGVGKRNAGAEGGNVGIEDESDGGLVTRDLSAHGSLRATSSTIGDTTDLDLLFKSISKTVRNK